MFRFVLTPALRLPHLPVPPAKRGLPKKPQHKIVPSVNPPTPKQRPAVSLPSILGKRSALKDQVERVSCGGGGSVERALDQRLMKLRRREDQVIGEPHGAANAYDRGHG
jgi:hypothetical protein